MRVTQESEGFEKLASELSYLQRKALRRLGRGRSIGRSMAADPLLARCFVIDSPPLPVHGDVMEYCDWEARALHAFAHPALTDYGRELLSALEALTSSNSTEE